MNKYTTVATEARHYVQYDQGKTAQHLSSLDFLIKFSSIKEGDGDLTVGEQQEGGKIAENYIVSFALFIKHLQVVQNNNGTSRVCSMRNTNISENLKVM
jgi:hypothetical protein